MSKKYTALLCEGRHAVNVPYYFAIFGEVVNVTDFGGLYETAKAKLPADCGELYLIVTGLTPATLAVVRACTERGTALTALNYDRQSGQYYPQVVPRQRKRGELENYLFVSDYKDEWQTDRNDIKKGQQLVYVNNLSDPDCSEFGMIGVKRTIAAGLQRVW